MKKHFALIEVQPHALRAGVISSLILTICCLWMTGLSNLPRSLAFIVLFAVCFVLMMKSVVDLMVWVFGSAVILSGMGLGRSVRLLRRIF